MFQGCIITLVARSRSLTAENRIPYRANQNENCGGIVVLWQGFLLDVFTFSPVSVIPPMFHTYVNTGWRGAYWHNILCMTIWNVSVCSVPPGTILSEVQEGETWGPPNNAVSFRIPENIKQKNTLAMFIQANLMLVHMFNTCVAFYVRINITFNFLH